MRILLTSILLLLVFSHVLVAQSLNDRLLQESPEKLAREARERGDIVRGAILFHQGNIACAKCHQGTAVSGRLGPDLAKLGDDATDIHIIESILAPSKKIREGYETVVALTLDGQTVTGIVVEEDDKQVTIRDGNDIDRAITISRSELEAIRPGIKSNMPAELVNQLKNRQQFLDLLKYVFDLQTRAGSHDVVKMPTGKRRQLTPELSGLVNLKSRNCVACHQSKNELLANSKQPPRLSWSAKWLSPAYLQEFIAGPHEVKPGTTMPHVLGHLSLDERRETAKAISHFLVSKSGNEYQQAAIDSARLETGKEVFHSVGCVACHSPRDPSGKEIELADSVPLGDLSGKYGVEGLTAFLKDPLSVRPSGHMPNMLLTHREAVDLATYLLQPKISQDGLQAKSPFQLQDELAVKGRSFFQKYNCQSCHQEIEPSLVSVNKQIAFEDLRPTEGCLSDKVGSWPHHDWVAGERENIRAAIKNLDRTLSTKERIDVTLLQFNCTACHQRDGLGGVADSRRQYFQTTNLNLGEQGKIPPTLTGVGAKLKSAWMRDVFVNGRSVRPYMKTRMPQFGESNIGHLVADFGSVDSVPTIEFESIVDQKKVREEGLKLVGNRGLNCVACHTYRFKTSDTMPAVDLTEMAERLEKDWFYHYMLSPQQFSPNTVMPTFWPNGKAIRSDLTGSPKDQIEAIWLYLLDGRQARPPRGIIQEPLEIVVTDKAQMLRRKYPGIGKRGIGVGYPGGINIAFDAEQLRLGLLWRGRFVDPGGVWRGQGSGNVRPMGRPVEFPKGPDIDLFDEPWKVSADRPPQHQFQGYQLDAQLRPTFQYEVAGVGIKDTFQELRMDNGDIRLRRKIELSGDEVTSKLRFRLAEGTEIMLDDDTYRIDKRLSISSESPELLSVKESDGNRKLQMMVELKPSEVRKIEVVYSLK